MLQHANVLRCASWELLFSPHALLLLADATTKTCTVCLHALGEHVGTEHAPCWQNQVLRRSCYCLNYSAFWKVISLFCAFSATCMITSNYLPLQQHFGKLFGGSGCSSSNGRASHLPLGRSKERGGCASCTRLTGQAVSPCKHEINTLQQLTRLHKLQLASSLELIQKGSNSSWLAWERNKLRLFLLFNWWGKQKPAERGEDLTTLYQPQFKEGKRKKQQKQKQDLLYIFFCASATSGEINLLNIQIEFKRDALTPFYHQHLLCRLLWVDSSSFLFGKRWFICPKSWRKQMLFWQAEKAVRLLFPAGECASYSWCQMIFDI